MKINTYQEACQFAFDQAWDGFESQGWKLSLNCARLCSYRGEEGRRCAAGWLIPDEAFSEKMETKRTHVINDEDFVEPLATWFEHVREHDYESYKRFRYANGFLNDLQRVHDLCLGHLKQEMISFGRTHNLLNDRHKL